MKKCVVFTHIWCRKTPTLLENHLNVCFFLRKIEDTQMILQQSECLSATNICGQNTLLTCNFIFMQHNSHSDMVESLNLKNLNLKTCKLINIRLDLSHNMTKPTKWLCAQRRLRSAWASAQSDQSLRHPLEETLGPWLPIECTAKTDQAGWMPRLIWVFAGCTVILLVLSCRGTFIWTAFKIVKS